MEGDIITCQDCNWEGSMGYIASPCYAVSCKHVLPNVGLVVIHRKEPWEDGRPIGKVIKTVKWKNPKFWDWMLYILTGRPLPANKVDASLFKLYDDVVAKRAFNVPEKIATPKLGAKMYKRGRTTGITEGVILDESMTIWVDMGNGQMLLFTDVYRFSNKTLPGDSGGVNATDDGIVGITFAGPESGNYGFGIKATNIESELGHE
jgi:hypothetical protein